MPSIAVIIPCYNEAKRINQIAFTEFFLQYPGVHVCFVNDGSTDDTLEVLQKLKNNHPQVQVLNLPYNSGKGEAVRQGLINTLQNQNHAYFGYLDADLSTSLTEFLALYKAGKEKNADYIFGSRIKKLDSYIQRSFTRHIIGRMLATIIDKRFKLGCYDTQCGAKLFKKELLQKIIHPEFFTRWFFDVEIFIRIKKLQSKYNGYEHPLTTWINVKDSKINILSFPVVLKDLFILLAKY